MTDDLHKSTQDLIGTIERKDRRFRVAQGIFMISTLIALIVVISAQQRTLTGIKDQLAQAKSAQAAADKRTDESANKVIRRLDCIVIFFTLPNRADVTIDDIDKCSINRNQSVQQFFAQPESTPAEKPPNLTSGSSQPSGSTATPPATFPQPPAPTVPDPIHLLGVPICVPFTNVCAR